MTAISAPANIDGPGEVLSRPSDLTFLLHAAADRMKVELDGAAVEVGLKDVRDWLVLAALEDGQPRTQLELSKVVCVDKSTLIGVLDRLEQRGWIERRVDPGDRRARIPHITSSGRRLHDEFVPIRDAVEARALGVAEPHDRALLMDFLARIASR